MSSYWTFAELWLDEFQELLTSEERERIRLLTVELSSYRHGRTPNDYYHDWNGQKEWRAEVLSILEFAVDRRLDGLVRSAWWTQARRLPFDDSIVVYRGISGPRMVRWKIPVGEPCTAWVGDDQAQPTMTICGNYVTISDESEDLVSELYRTQEYYELRLLGIAHQRLARD